MFIGNIFLRIIVTTELNYVKKTNKKQQKTQTPQRQQKTKLASAFKLLLK